MKLHLAAIVGIAAAVTCACAFQAAADPADATIRGDRDKLLVVSTGTYVSGIDGRMIRPSPGLYEQPVAIAPGTHSLLVAFNANKFATLPVRFDAKPGAAYVIRWQRMEAKPGVTPPTFVWIEDERSRDIAMPKRQIWPIDRGAPYAAPAGASATIAGATGEEKRGPTAVYLAAVDGVYTAADAARAKPLAVAPGPRALLLAYDSDLFGAEYPVLLDLKPDHAYAIGFATRVVGAIADVAPPHLTVWIDDETTHERVLPQQIVPLKRIKFSVDTTPPPIGKR